MRYMVFISAVFAVPAQESPDPWRTDLVEARKQALKEDKPIVILMGLDHSVSEVKDVRAALARSPEFKELCRSTIVVGITNGHEDNDAIRREFGTWPRFPWVVVLNGKGERLGGVAFHKVMDRWARSADLFPRLVHGRIRGFLERKESLTVLEGRWTRERGSEELLDELARFHEDNLEYGRAAEVFDQAAQEPSYPRDVRETFRIRAFLSRCQHGTGSDLSPERGNAILEEAGRLLSEIPDHPLLYGANRAIVNSSDVREVFDLPGKRDALLEAIKKKRVHASNPERIDYQVENIGSSLQWLIDSWIKHRDAGGDGEEAELKRARSAAKLGEAKVTVDFFSRPPYDENTVYQAWVREAKDKLAR